MSIELPKLFIHRKVSIHFKKNQEKINDILFDSFLKYINVEVNRNMSEFISFAYDNNFNRDDFISLLQKNGYLIHNDQWNAYDSLDEFLYFIKDSEYCSKSFCEHFVLFNAFSIIDNILSKSNEEVYSLSTLCEEIKRIELYEKERYSDLDELILNDFLGNSYIYLEQLLKDLFTENYLINYSKENQLKIINYTEYFIDDMIDNKKISFDIKSISILEEIFNINGLEKKLEKKLVEYTSNTSNKISSTISSQYNQFYNLIKYDVVDKLENGELYLNVLSSVLLTNYIRVVYTDILKELKHNKTKRVLQELKKYRLKSKDETFKYLERSLTLSGIRGIPYIVDLYYKEFNFEQLTTDLNKIHNYMSINKNSLIKNEKNTSDNLSLREKTISYLTNITSR